jgi:hypothetical protein
MHDSSTGSREYENDVPLCVDIRFEASSTCLNVQDRHHFCRWICIVAPLKSFGGSARVLLPEFRNCKCIQILAGTSGRLYKSQDHDLVQCL